MRCQGSLYVVIPIKEAEFRIKPHGEIHEIFDPEFDKDNPVVTDAMQNPIGMINDTRRDANGNLIIELKFPKTIFPTL